MNERHVPTVAVRPMTRADVDGYAAWGRHTDALYANYDVPPLDRAAADAFWRHLAGRPAERRPLAGFVDGRFAAHVIVRYRTAATADLGIALDPALVGRGFGRRLLRATAAYLRGRERLERLTIEAATYNERAIAAYRAAGFRPIGERVGPPDPGLDLEMHHARLEPHLVRTVEGWHVRIVTMEMALGAESFDSEPTSCRK
jgi:RimJ/RimL family protein N-acetyltransferase